MKVDDLGIQTASELRAKRFTQVGQLMRLTVAGLNVKEKRAYGQVGLGQRSEENSAAPIEPMDTLGRNPARRARTRAVARVTAVLVVMFSLAVFITPTGASAMFAAPLCGDGSAPDYGFTYDRQQAHWTVGWQAYVSEKTVTEVDTVLDQLNSDSIAQTMILIQSPAQVGNRVNCAVHFLRYMQLGLTTGERKDNGFVFLIVVDPTAIDVHYGVGLGLPALTAPDLTALNRAAEEAYQSNHSLDQALVALVQEFDTVARSKYAPLISSAASAQTTTNQPPVPTGPQGLLAVCGQLCLGLFFLLLLMGALSQFARRGIIFNRFGGGSWGAGFPLGGGGGRSGPSMRGGGGSGRSGRGN